MRRVTRSEAESFALGEELAGGLGPGWTVLLSGELGAGKSVLARGIARGLGIFCPMPSPTFTLMQPYEGRVKLCHFDLYRLSDAEEFYAAGLDEYIGGDGVALIEWPLQDLDWPAPLLTVSVSRGGAENERIIEAKEIRP